MVRTGLDKQHTTIYYVMLLKKMFQHRLSVKLQFNSEDLWTKACRHMLTNLKWGLAFAGVKYLKREDASGSAPSPTQVEETVAD